MKISKTKAQQLMASTEKPPVPQQIWKELNKKYDLDIFKTYYQFFQIIDLLILNEIHQDLTKEARLHCVFDMAREVVEEQGQQDRIWNGGLPQEWLKEWKKRISIPKPKELYYQYSKQQQKIEKNHETIMEKYKAQETMIEEQNQKISELQDELQATQVRMQDTEDELSLIQTKNEYEGKGYQQRIQKWIDIVEKLEQQIEEFRQKQEKNQVEKEKMKQQEIQIQEMEKTQKEAIKRFDQIQQIDEEDFEMNAYDIDQTQTQRFNRRRYFAKWLDENQVLGKKEIIDRWKKMRGKYWNIDCLGKSQHQKDIIINKKGWITFLDEMKKCYKSCIIIEWNNWMFAVKIRKINFINKKYMNQQKAQMKMETNSQDEWQELEEFDEIYF